MRARSRALIAATGLLVLAGLVPGAKATPAAPQENVRHITTVPGSTGGHVAVEGNRLYVGAYGLGMTIFDVSNPAAPVKIGEYKPVSGQAGFTPSGGDPGLRADAVPDAAFWDGRHIAALNGTGRTSGTQQTEFLDVTDPAAPVLLHRFAGSEHGEAHNGDIVDSRRLWLPSGGGGGSGLRIYDMSPLLADPPAAPARIFGGNPHTLWINSPYRGGKPAGDTFGHTHDVEVYTDYELLLRQDEWVDQDGDGTPDPTYDQRDIVLLAGSVGYALGAPNDTTAAYIIDITDPANPVVINKWQHKNTGGDSIRYLHELQFLDGDPRVMIATDEDLHSGCEASMVYTVGLSDDLTEATKLDEWAPGSGTLPNCSAHVFSSNDQYVFMGAYNAGLQVLDLSDPADIKRAGYYIAEGHNAWGALYNRGYIYTGDFGARGLDVFEFIPDPYAKALLKANNPATRTGPGIAEAGCRFLQDPFGPTNETDGLIVAIPEDKRDGTHTIRATGSSSGLPYDLDIWFHDEACTGMGAPTGTATDSPDEMGLIPPDAAFASVDLYTGPPTYVYVQIDP